MYKNKTNCNMRSKLGYCNITGDLCEDIPVKWCKRLGEAYRQGFSSGIKFYSDIQEEELELDSYLGREETL